MGFINNRAICPNCGGKIHTQARGLGALIPVRSGVIAKTGTQCQHCGTALTGRVGVDNRAVSVAADEAKRARRSGEPTAADVERQRAIHQKAHDRYQVKAAKNASAAEMDRRLLNMLAAGPVTFADAAERLGASTMELARAQTRLGRQVKASGMGKKRTLRLSGR